MVDKLIECEPGVHAIGTKSFPRSDILFMDHFPGMPLVPGVLQIEMIAQLGGKCISLAEPTKLPVLGNVKNARFLRPIAPGDICVIKATVTKISGQFSQIEGSIEVEGQKCCTASILFGHMDRSKVTHFETDRIVDDLNSRTARGEQKNESAVPL
jgi:3-hydroxyacyl-[acyl-carrier-protein] dehydratase